MSEQSKGFEQSIFDDYYYSLPIPNEKESEFFNQLSPGKAYNIFDSLATQISSISSHLDTDLIIFNAYKISLKDITSNLNLTRGEEKDYLTGIKDGVYTFIGLMDFIYRSRLIDRSFTDKNLLKPLFPVTNSELDMTYKLQTNINHDESFIENPYRTLEDYIRYTILAPSIFDLLDKIIDTRANTINVNNGTNTKIAYGIGFENSFANLSEISMKMHIRKQLSELEKKISD